MIRITALILFSLNLICLLSVHAETQPPPPQYFIWVKDLSSGSDAVDITHIKEISKYAYQETVTALLNRLFFELSRTQETQVVHTEVFVVLLKAIGKTATVNSLVSLQQFNQGLEEIALSIKDDETRKKQIDPIKEIIEKVSGTLAARKDDIPSAFNLVGDHHDGLILLNKPPILASRAEPKLIIEKTEKTEAKPVPSPVVVAPATPIEPSKPEVANAVPLTSITESKTKHKLKASLVLGWQKLVGAMQWLFQPTPYARNQQPSPTVETEFTDEENLKRAAAQELLQEPADIPQLSYEDILHTLSNMRTFLDGGIVGQPEAIDSLIRMERESLMLGSKIPSKRVFMGLQGSGATTIAKVFTDAVNGQVGAYEKHMFNMPVMNNRFEMNNIRGAPTGVIGSGHVSEFYKFVVQHSAGRYMIEKIGEGANEASRIVENPKWSPGKLIPGYYLPEQAVINIEKFHLWIKQAKDLILVEGLTTGRFKVANPAGGVSELIVPMKFLISTHEGTSLLASRELNGQRHGEPLSYEEMMNKWEIEHLNPDRLKNEMRRSNGSVNATTDTSEMPGISENMISTFGDGEILLLRPHSPAGLKKIVELKLEEMKVQFKESERLVGPLQITWSKELVEFLASYHHLAEENATPIEGRVKNMVQDLLLQAFERSEIKPSKQLQELHLNIQRNEDKTYSLVVEKTQRQVVRKNAEGQDISAPEDITKKIPILIGATLFEKDQKPITDEQIDSILDLGRWMKTRVFNVEKIIDRLIRHYLTSVESTRQKVQWHEAKTPAQRYMFLGFSSTGKSEVTKVFAEAKYKKRTAIMTVDFGQIKTIDHLREKFLGTRDRNNNPIPSDFMKEYDRNNGNLIVLLDEGSNAPPEVFKMMHEIFREPVVVFSDNQPRKMAGVTFVITGNAGEEWMTAVPRDIPVEQQLAAMNSMFESASGDPETRRELLEEYFHPALINRIGENNIFFYGPLTFKAIRQLTQLKLGMALDELKPKDAKRGWNLQFESKEDYLKLVDMVEDIGFVLHEQGASIDRFIREDLMDSIHFQLLSAKIPTNTDVMIKVQRLEDIFKEDKKYKAFRVDLVTQTKTLPIEFKGRAENVLTKEDQVSKFLTAVHEAGHELANKILFDDSYSPVRVSLIPGVTKRSNKWIYYAGIAMSKAERRLRINRGTVIRTIAEFMAGDVAQRLVTKGAIHDAGKSDDMQRATSLARRAILHYGLSDKFGSISMPEDMSLAEQMAMLSPRQKEIFASEVEQFLKEGRELAQSVLKLNLRNALLPLANELAEKGEMVDEEIVDFYKRHDVQMHVAVEKAENAEESNSSSYTLDPLYPELIDGVELPKQFADVTQIAIKMKRDAVAEVPLPESLPLISDCETRLTLQ